WYNAVLTVVVVGVLARVAGPVWRWVFTLAHWQAVTVNLRLFIVGLYPGDQLWRPGLVLILLAWLLGGSAAHQKGMVRSVSSTLLASLVLLTLALTASARLLVGGAALALLAGYYIGRLWPQGRQVWLGGWLLSLPIVFIILGGLHGTGLS